MAREKPTATIRPARTPYQRSMLATRPTTAGSMPRRTSTNSAASTPNRAKIRMWWPIASQRSSMDTPPLDQPAPVPCRADEAGEQRMRIERSALQFRVELDADEPGMVNPFAELRQHAIGRQTGEFQ